MFWIISQHGYILGLKVYLRHSVTHRAPTGAWNIMKDNSYGDDTAGIIYIQSYVPMYYTALLLYVNYYYNSTTTTTPSMIIQLKKNIYLIQ